MHPVHTRSYLVGVVALAVTVLGAGAGRPVPRSECSGAGAT